MLIKFEDFQNLGIKGFQSVTAAAASTAKRLQPIAIEAIDYSSKSFSNSYALADKLAKVRNPDEFVGLHSNFVKVALEDFFASSTKIGKLYSELAEELLKAFANGGLKAITEEPQKQIAPAAKEDAPKAQAAPPQIKDASSAQSASPPADAPKPQAAK